MIKGRLKAWNDDKGFGFIQSDALERDVFVHISALQNMSRKPIVGDIIYFDIERQADGKVRARDCEIEGVSAISKKPYKSKTKKSSAINLSNIIAPVLSILAVYTYLHFKGPQTNSASAPISETMITDLSKQDVNHFHCDGREYCGQMTSRAEAEYFIENCPNTKMDGDHDGIPCENDSRF